jgi:hypothetical protein
MGTISQGKQIYFLGGGKLKSAISPHLNDVVKTIILEGKKWCVSF